MAGLGEHPQREQLRYECDYETLAEVSRAPPRPLLRNFRASSFIQSIKEHRLTPSNRHLCCRHRLVLDHHRCPPLLPLRFRRQVLAETGRRQVRIHHGGMRRGILEIFCSCPMVRLAPLRIDSEPILRAEQ